MDRTLGYLKKHINIHDFLSNGRYTDPERLLIEHIVRLFDEFKLGERNYNCIALTQAENCMAESRKVILYLTTDQLTTACY